MSKIAVIGVPSSAGARQTGQELAPSAFRELGLIERLRSSGVDVLDFGDLPTTSFSPDPSNPKSQNSGLVLEVTKMVADVVSKAVGAGARPIVLGGDCTVLIGVLSGMLNHERDLGLVYFDGDVDLNTPETTLSGIFDGMVMAHVLGLTSDNLGRIGPRFPLMDQNDVIFFGYNRDAGFIDPPEVQLLSQLPSSKHSSGVIRGNARAAARETLEVFGPSIKKLIVHFDVDVIDGAEFPAADLPHRHGLSYSDTMEALNVFVSAPAFGGLVVTEFNVHHDRDKTHAQRLVDSVGKLIEAACDKWHSSG